MLDFDEMLFAVGEFGIYQKALFVFQAPFCIFVTFVLFGQLFMTLYPLTIWCEDRFGCTNGNLTPAQRQNYSFGYAQGVASPCFLNNFAIINPSFMESVSTWSTRECRGRPNNESCIFNQTINGNFGDPRIGNPQAIASLPNEPVPPQYGNAGQGRPGSNGYGGYGGYRPHYPTISPPRWGGNDNYYDTQPPNRNDNSGFQSTLRPNPGRPTPGRPDSGRPNPGRPSESDSDSDQNMNPNIAGGSPSRQRGQHCDRIYNVTLRNTTRIILRDMIDMNRHNGPYVILNEKTCRNISWDRVGESVPYPTIVTDGNWWCDADMFNTVSQAVFFVGAIVGGFLIGWIADSYGRVPALVIANLLGAIGGALSVVSTNIYLFSFFRFITGMAFDNCFVMMYILVLEFCGPSYRTLVANLSIAVFYTMGTLILPWLALLIGNWRIYGLAISLPMFLGLLAIFVVPESARWLLSKGRAKEATDILRSFAKVNRRNVDERVFVEFENDALAAYKEMQAEDDEQSFTAALKTPRLRRTFILLVIIWSLVALVYDGHSRNILNLADQQWNVFWMFTIASSTEFPADILLIFTLDRFGRRWLSFGSLTLSGAASIIAAAIPLEMRTLGLVMAMISRFFVNVAFNIGLQYAAELLPTVIRAQGVNAIHIMGYVASIISPFVASIGRTQPAISLILLGIFAITGGCLSLFLAETLGEDLPNTLEEAEAFGKGQSFWNCPICAKVKEDEQPIEEPPEQVTIRRRNMNLRSSIRGETYRSSMISGNSRDSHHMHPPVALQPLPANEKTALRRITH